MIRDPMGAVRAARPRDNIDTKLCLWQKPPSGAFSPKVSLVQSIRPFGTHSPCFSLFPFRRRPPPPSPRRRGGGRLLWLGSFVLLPALRGAVSAAHTPAPHNTAIVCAPAHRLEMLYKQRREISPF